MPADACTRPAIPPLLPDAAFTSRGVAEGVLSKVTVTVLLSRLVLPATSVAVSGLDVAVPVVPEMSRVWSAGQVAIPESASEQVKCTVTGPV